MLRREVPWSRAPSLPGAPWSPCYLGWAHVGWNGSGQSLAGHHASVMSPGSLPPEPLPSGPACPLCRGPGEKHGASRSHNPPVPPAGVRRPHTLPAARARDQVWLLSGLFWALYHANRGRMTFAGMLVPWHTPNFLYCSSRVSSAPWAWGQGHPRALGEPQ